MTERMQGGRVYALQKITKIRKVTGCCSPDQCGTSGFGSGCACGGYRGVYGAGKYTGDGRY